MRERSRTVECQQVKSSRRMGLRQRKRVKRWVDFTVPHLDWQNVQRRSTAKDKAQVEVARSLYNHKNSVLDHILRKKEATGSYCTDWKYRRYASTRWIADPQISLMSSVIEMVCLNTAQYETEAQRTKTVKEIICLTTVVVRRAKEMDKTDEIFYPKILANIR